MEYFNNKFKEKNIPIKIKSEEPSDELKDIIKKIISCSPSFEDKNNEYYLLFNTINNDFIGILIINLLEKCLYINYICVNDKYRGLGIGIFLGFMAVKLGIDLKKELVISTGVGQYVNAPYERISIGNRWVLSQALLIEKLGFIDGYKKESYNINKLKNVSNKCQGESGETYLELSIADDKLEKYKTQFENNTTELFKKYLNFIKKEGGYSKKSKKITKKSKKITKKSRKSKKSKKIKLSLTDNIRD